MRGAAALAAGLGLLAAAGSALAAECALTAMRVTVNSTGLAGGILPVDGLPPLPVTIDEAAGTLALDLSAFPTTSFTIVGVENEIDFPPTPFAGTIDAAGNVTVYGVTMNLVTHFGGTPTPVFAAPDLTTGIAAVTISGTSIESAGAALDFATGVLRLAGEAVMEAAPGAGGAISTGLDLTCVLSPVPDPAALPPGPALTLAKGVARAAKDPALGERLLLKAAFVRGAGAPDPIADGVFLAVGDAEGTVVLLRVPPGTLAAKGRALRATDADGSRFQVLEGRRQGAATPGRLVLVRTKKGWKVALRQDGLDLAALGTSGTVTLDVGPATASDMVTVRRKGRKLTLR